MPQSIITSLLLLDAIISEALTQTCSDAGLPAAGIEGAVHVGEQPSPPPEECCNADPRAAHCAWPGEAKSKLQHSEA